MKKTPIKKIRRIEADDPEECRPISTSGLQGGGTTGPVYENDASGQNREQQKRNRTAEAIHLIAPPDIQLISHALGGNAGTAVHSG